MHSLRTIILAAGKGTRMKSSVPKVLHLICGKPMIQYVLDVAKDVRSLKTYVVVGHKSQDVQNILGKQFIVVEQKRLLGTADAIRCVEKKLRGYRGDVLTLCGDTPLLNKATIKVLLKKHHRSHAVCTFLTTVVLNPEGYGRIIRDEKGTVVAIREDKDASGLEKDINLINVGAYCFKSQEMFKALRQIQLNKKKKEFYLTDLIEAFYEQGLKIETIETEDANEGLGINTKEDLARAETIMRRRVLSQFMQDGVTIVDPETTYIDASVKIGTDTVIRPFTFIEENVKIGNGCEIGPFAHLRPGTRIAHHVTIGNFTEVSRSRVGKRTIMKHFGFLGDATVGDGVNIGAGVVTANYDGQKKNPTKISHGAFIGSDAILIAPVQVGKKSVIGAGSVVTKGRIPDGCVAMGVPARIKARDKKT